MVSDREIGGRVRAALAKSEAFATQFALAEAIDMTPDALSRALNGTRAFSSVEITRIAEVLGEDVHWLITGEPDPLAVRFVARHDYDTASRRYGLPDGHAESPELDGVALAYQQAAPWISPRQVELPRTAAAMRAALGDGFVADFADRIEARLGVDVVRVQGPVTDYSFTITERPVILLRSTPNWFRSNWSLGHELAHLALGHSVADATNEPDERTANAFAAELLMPRSEMRALDWGAVDEAELASLLWQYGVSLEALTNRLQGLRIHAPILNSVNSRGSSTQGLLRTQQAAIPHDMSPDPISARMQKASERRIPVPLIAAHLRGIAEGRLGKGTLAWLLETTPDELEVETPRPDPLSADALLHALGAD